MVVTKAETIPLEKLEMDNNIIDQVKQFKNLEVL